MTFFVDGNPVPKGRPRFARGRTYTPKSTEQWERLVATVALSHKVKPTADNVELTLIFRLPTRRRLDIDNLCKGVMDGLNRVAWKDDAQVVKLVATKHCTEPPHGVEITICAENEPSS